MGVSEKGLDPFSKGSVVPSFRDWSGKLGFAWAFAKRCLSCAKSTLAVQITSNHVRDSSPKKPCIVWTWLQLACFFSNTSSSETGNQKAIVAIMNLLFNPEIEKKCPSECFEIIILTVKPAFLHFSFPSWGARVLNLIVLVMAKQGGFVWTLTSKTETVPLQMLWIYINSTCCWLCFNKTMVCTGLLGVSSIQNSSERTGMDPLHLIMCSLNRHCAKSLTVILVRLFQFQWDASKSNQSSESSDHPIWSEARPWNNCTTVT